MSLHFGNSRAVSAAAPAQFLLPHSCQNRILKQLRRCFSLLTTRVFTNGKIEVRTDTKLVDKYGITRDNDKGKDKKSTQKAAAAAAAPATSTDHYC